MEDGRRLGREFLLQVFADCKKAKALMRESFKMELTPDEQAEIRDCYTLLHLQEALHGEG